MRAGPVSACEASAVGGLAAWHAKEEKVLKVRPWLKGVKQPLPWSVQSATTGRLADGLCCCCGLLLCSM